MSDLTDLLDNAADLLRTLQNLEQAHNLGDRLEVDTILYGLDPVDIKYAERDIRALSESIKNAPVVVHPIGDGTTGHDTASAMPTGALPSTVRPFPSSVPEHPGFSVKVPCE